MIDENTRLRLKKALADLDALPAMPVIAQKLLALPLNTDEGEAQLLNLVGQDPQISARLIGLSNTSAMGVSRKINSVKEAAMLLGLNRVKTIALGIASMSGLSKAPASEYFKPQDLWLHSLTIAIVMRTIAQSMPRNMRPNEDQIYLAGLIHDIGFMALHHVDAASSNELHRQLQLQPGRPVMDVELETLGMTHCYIGAQLGQHWHLPPEIIAVIGYHHPPYVDEISSENPLVRMVSIAEKLLPDFGIAEHTGVAVSEEEWQSLGIDPSEAEEISNLANEVAVQTAQMGDAF